MNNIGKHKHRCVGYEEDGILTGCKKFEYFDKQQEYLCSECELYKFRFEKYKTFDLWNSARELLDMVCPSKPMNS